MLNDIRALNDLAPLMSGRQAKLRQLIDHLREFKDGIAQPNGVGIGLVSPQEAKALAEDLVTRTRGVDVRLGQMFANGLATAGREIRGNAVFHDVCKTVLEGLMQKADNNHEYGEHVGMVLFIHDYIDDPEPPRP
jgi:hypothetical protein